jgi:hypothetical protein
VSPARRDNERDLLTRIARERNPVKKAKYEVRLARVKLFQAMEALDRKDVEGSQKLLRDYLERLKSAWATLQSSGRSAHRKPQGFKELDIELREDARYLEDLKHRFSYLDRGPVEKTAQEVEHLRSVVLKALFPPPQPRKP